MSTRSLKAVVLCWNRGLHFSRDAGGHHQAAGYLAGDLGRLAILREIAKVVDSTHSGFQI